MTERAMKTNQAIVAGKVVSGLKYSHSSGAQRFYIMNLASMRPSGQEDIIPLLLSDKMIDVKTDYRGMTLEAAGEFRSYNRREGRRVRLILTLFVREMYFAEQNDIITDSNQIYLEGFVAKEPVYRVTPLGWQITDLFLAVRRRGGRSDYIPCVAWGKYAKLAAGLEMSTYVYVRGRIQSRAYTKKTDSGESVHLTAYEVSVNELDYEKAGG